MNTADDPDGIALPPRCIDARAEPAIEVLLQALFGSESGLEGAPDLQPQLSIAVDAFMRGHNPSNSSLSTVICWIVFRKRWIVFR